MMTTAHNTLVIRLWKSGFVSLAAPMWLTMGCRDHHLKQTEYYGTGLNGLSVASIRGLSQG